MLVRPRVLAGKRQVRTQTKYVAKEIASSVKYALAVKLTVKKILYVTENIHTINGKTKEIGYISTWHNLKISDS